MITVCAAAHPCAKLVRSDNRALWGTLFMLFIWQHTEKKAESCLDSIKKCSVVCIMYLYLVMGGESVFVVIKQHLHHRIFCLRKRGKKLIFFCHVFSPLQCSKDASGISIFHSNGTTRSLISNGFSWPCTIVTVLLASVQMCDGSRFFQISLKIHAVGAFLLGCLRRQTSL